MTCWRRFEHSAMTPPLKSNTSNNSLISTELARVEYPERFALSALIARLLGEQQKATVRWADWAEPLVSSWDTPSGADAKWGVKTIRDTGEAFPDMT